MPSFLLDVLMRSANVHSVIPTEWPYVFRRVRPPRSSRFGTASGVMLRGGFALCRRATLVLHRGLKAKVGQSGLDMCRGDGRPLRFSSRLLPGISLNGCPGSKSAGLSRLPMRFSRQPMHRQPLHPSRPVSLQAASVRQYTSLSAPTLPSLPPRNYPPPSGAGRTAQGRYSHHNRCRARSRELSDQIKASAGRFLVQYCPA